MFYTTWTESGNNPFWPECQLQRLRCHVKADGWYELSPNKCNFIVPGTWWQVYLSVFRTDGDKWVAADFPLRELDRNEVGLSGVTGLSLCGKYRVNFERDVSATLKEARDETCGGDLRAIPVNLVVRGAPQTVFTATLR